MEERKEFVEKYMPLVEIQAKRIAKKLPLHTGLVEFDDLLNYGIIGLLDAVEKFDESRGAVFSTYAEYRIKGAILDGLRTVDPLSRSLRREIKLKEIEKGNTNHFRLNPPFLISLDASISGKDLSESGTNLAEFLNNSGGINDNFDRCLIKKILSFSCLSDRERKIIAFYYFYGFTMKEIGKEFKVTNPRISQMHKEAILKIRRFINNDTFRKIKKRGGDESA